MKKIAYNAPEMEEIKLNTMSHLLEGSTGNTGGGDPGIVDTEPDPDDVVTD